MVLVAGVLLSGKVGDPGLRNRGLGFGDLGFRVQVVEGGLSLSTWVRSPQMS